jgi:hypothetical protein
MGPSFATFLRCNQGAYCIPRGYRVTTGRVMQGFGNFELRSKRQPPSYRITVFTYRIQLFTPLSSLKTMAANCYCYYSFQWSLILLAMKYRTNTYCQIQEVPERD